MLLTKSNNQELGIRKRTINREFKLGPLSIQFVTIVILSALALLYLVQSTEGATKNYQIRELENKKSQLQDDKDRLEVESIRLKSINEIKDKTQSMGLESFNQVNYLPGDHVLVKR